MPESDDTVQCPICDTDFDPAVAGGWCTNPDCGEWQHSDETAVAVDTDDGVSDDADLILEGTDEAASPAGATDGVDAADDRGDTDAANGASDTGAAEAGETDLEAATGHEKADTGDDSRNGLGAGGTDESDDEPAQSGDSDPHAGASDETTDTEDEAVTITCPDCGRELDADANFCVDCGSDVQDITPGADGSLDACPTCDTAVDDDDSFCVNCGEDLDAHRGETATSTTDSVSDASAADETATESATADTAVDTLASQSSDDATVPDKLVLSVEGRDITVGDGDRIGREIRAALLDAGRPEDEAVRIHREHVRLDRQPEGYYLVDLGDNPTRLNGTPLQKGDRKPIQPGDELELSGVATMTIQAA